jgi:hypothetical protein
VALHGHAQRRVAAARLKGRAGQGAGGVLQLPESNISDEEVHALAALLRNNTTIEELNLRGNNVTDDGARALGAVLAGLDPAGWTSRVYGVGRGCQRADSWVLMCS